MSETQKDHGTPGAGPPGHGDDDHGKDIVEITIDGKQYKIHRGRATVADIKALAGIPLAYQLDQDVNGVLTPLDQAGSVTIKPGDVFVSYPATGSSS